VTGDKNTADIKVWVTPELKWALQKLADDDDRELSAYLRVLLRDHVASMQRAAAITQVKPSGRIGPQPFDDDNKIA
jgi:hypothetical protein